MGDSFRLRGCRRARLVELVVKYIYAVDWADGCVSLRVLFLYYLLSVAVAFLVHKGSYRDFTCCGSAGLVNRPRLVGTYRELNATHDTPHAKRDRSEG